MYTTVTRLDLIARRIESLVVELGKAKTTAEKEKLKQEYFENVECFQEELIRVVARPDIEHQIQEIQTQIAYNQGFVDGIEKGNQDLEDAEADHDQIESQSSKHIEALKEENAALYAKIAESEATIEALRRASAAGLAK